MTNGAQEKITAAGPGHGGWPRRNQESLALLLCHISRPGAEVVPDGGFTWLIKIVETMYLTSTTGFQF